MPARLKEKGIKYNIGGMTPYVNKEGVTVPGMYQSGGSMYQDWNQQRKFRKRRRQWEKGKIDSSTYEGDLPWFQ